MLDAIGKFINALSIALEIPEWAGIVIALALLLGPSIAILVSPIIALRVGNKMAQRQNAREAKMWVFKTLMATRRAIFSGAHVDALNRIDLEFNRKIPKEKEVIDAWRAHHDHLHNPPLRDAQSARDQWDDKSLDLLNKLLLKMALAMGYHDFNETSIKNSVYMPRGYREDYVQDLSIRARVLAILEGKEELPIKVVSSRAIDTDGSEDLQAPLRRAFLEVLEGKRTVRVEIASPSESLKDE